MYNYIDTHVDIHLYIYIHTYIHTTLKNDKMMATSASMRNPERLKSIAEAMVAKQSTVAM